MDVSQDDDYLSLMGLDSRSTLVNLISMVGVFLLLPILHAVISPIYC